MNRIETLFNGALAKVHRFDHPRNLRHKDEQAEAPGAYAISFVEAGSFSVEQQRESWRFGENDVLLSYPGRARKYVHSTEFPADVCLTVEFGPGVVEETPGARPGSPGVPRIPACDRMLFERVRILRALQSRDAFGIESVALNLIPVLAADTRGWSSHLRRSSRFPHYSNRVRSAIEMLDAEFARNLSLSEVSRRVGMSPFHFSRIFTALAGRSPHQYLLGVRLLHASRRLRQGDSVTNAAFESGFHNLSHFIRVFRKRFGVSPGAYRTMRAGGAPKVRSTI